MSDGCDFILGCDLGRQVDPAAVVVLSRSLHPVEPGQDEQYAYDIRFAQELDLGTEYPTILNYLRDLVTHHKIVNRVNVALDKGGVGIAVMDFLRQMPELADLTWGITATSGRTTKQEMMEFTVPKADLVAATQVVMQSGRLRGLDDGDLEIGKLLRQIYDFEFKRTAAGNLKMEAEQSKHDDMVFALMVAIWLGNRLPFDGEGPVGSSGIAPYKISDGPQGGLGAAAIMGSWRDDLDKPQHLNVRR